MQQTTVPWAGVVQQAAAEVAPSDAGDNDPETFDLDADNSLDHHDDDYDWYANNGPGDGSDMPNMGYVQTKVRQSV